jgi:hypothetical protein
MIVPNGKRRNLDRVAGFQKKAEKYRDKNGDLWIIEQDYYGKGYSAHNYDRYDPTPEHSLDTPGDPEHQVFGDSVEECIAEIEAKVSGAEGEVEEAFGIMASSKNAVKVAGMAEYRRNEEMINQLYRARHHIGQVGLRAWTDKMKDIDEMCESMLTSISEAMTALGETEDLQAERLEADPDYGANVKVGPEGVMGEEATRERREQEERSFPIRASRANAVKVAGFGDDPSSLIEEAGVRLQGWEVGNLDKRIPAGPGKPETLRSLHALISQMGSIGQTLERVSQQCPSHDCSRAMSHNVSELSRLKSELEKGGVKFRKSMDPKNALDALAFALMKLNRADDIMAGVEVKAPAAPRKRKATPPKALMADEPQPVSETIPAPLRAKLEGLPPGHPMRVKFLGE